MSIPPTPSMYCIKNLQNQIDNLKLENTILKERLDALEQKFTTPSIPCEDLLHLESSTNPFDDPNYEILTIPSNSLKDIKLLERKLKSFITVHFITYMCPSLHAIADDPEFTTTSCASLIRQHYPLILSEWTNRGIKNISLAHLAHCIHTKNSVLYKKQFDNIVSIMNVYDSHLKQYNVMRSELIAKSSEWAAKLPEIMW